MRNLDSARPQPQHLPSELGPREAALLALGRWLREKGYGFTTVTPETHRRVNARPASAEARSVRDVLGWSRPFRPGLLPAPLHALLEQADALAPAGEPGLLRARVRVSTLGGGLYVHSAYPTEAADSVFFGPDTYRFCALVSRLPGTFQRVVDVGCGTGAGGLSLAARAAHLVLADVNPEALRLARVNALLNGAPHAEPVHSDVLSGVTGPAPDLVLANPPYLDDADGRTYRHGGGGVGTALSLRIAREALARLAPGGTLVLYTGAPIVAGEDLLASGLRPLLAEADVAEASYEELDPDVFSEELELPLYREVERIAVVALVARRRR